MCWLCQARGTAHTGSRPAPLKPVADAPPAAPSR